MFNSLAPVLLEEGFVAELFNNIADFLKAFGSYFVLLVGTGLVIVSILQIAKGMSSRKAQTNWLSAILCLLVGGILLFGGWKMITGDYIGKPGKATSDVLMQGNTPTAIADVTDGADSTTAGAAKKAIKSMTDAFILPFGRTLAVSTGILLVILAIAAIAKHFMIKSGYGTGRAPTPWAKIACMALIGSLLFAATPTDNSQGWKWIKDTMVGGVKDSVDGIVDGDAKDEASEQTPDDFETS